MAPVIHRAIRAGAIVVAIAMPFVLVRPVTPSPRRVETIALAAPAPSSPPEADAPPLFAVLGNVDAAAPAAGAPPQPLGIVGRLPDDGRALVRVADGSVHALAVGEAAQGWTLAGIAPDRLRFRRNGEERMLVLPIVAAGDGPPKADQ